MHFMHQNSLIPLYGAWNGVSQMLQRTSSFGGGASSIAQCNNPPARLMQAMDCYGACVHVGAKHKGHGMIGRWNEMIRNHWHVITRAWIVMEHALE